MIARGIFVPVLPEIAHADPLNRLVSHERALEVVGDPWRRLAALLPPEPATAERVAARLRLSKQATARLVCAAGRSAADAALSVKALAYWHGAACARDRLLLGDEEPAPVALSALDGWSKPRLPFGGGELIARGLPAGPLVARTLGAIERRWVEAGHPEEDDLQTIVADQLAAALRSSQ